MHACLKRRACIILRSGTETILRAEDDPALRERTATLLRRLGYKVLAAANGIEAVALRQGPDVGHIDLLFADIVMPHMSGKEPAGRVQALNPHTGTLFTSAYTENAVVHQRALDGGFSDSRNFRASADGVNGFGNNATVSRGPGDGRQSSRPDAAPVKEKQTEGL